MKRKWYLQSMYWSSKQVHTVREGRRPHLPANEHVSGAQIEVSREMLVEPGYLDRRERTPWGVTGDLIEMLGGGGRNKRVSGWQVRLEGRIVRSMMFHQRGVIENLPVDTVRGQILDMVVYRVRSGSDAVEAARAVFDHTEQKELSWAGGALAADAQSVSVPALGPFVGILVESMQKEVVDEPDMGRAIGVECVAALQLKEELFPLAAEAMRDVVP